MILELDERFVNKDVRESHYNTHVLRGKRYEKEVFQGIDIDEYERMADELATKPLIISVYLDMFPKMPMVQ